MIRSNAFASKLMSQKQFNNQILILFCFYKNSIGINLEENNTHKQTK